MKRGNPPKSIKTKLDDAVHGHLNAKRQLERIIGQWINGEKSGKTAGIRSNIVLKNVEAQKFSLWINF